MDADPTRHGQTVCDLVVEPVSRLREADFDGIVIATFDWQAAKDAIFDVGCTPDALYSDVFWEPFFLQIEPTTMCTYTCPSCSRNTLPATRRNRHMSLDDFQRLISRFPTIKRLQLQGLGEPTLNPALIDMLRISKDRGINTSITTNAYALRRDIERGLLKHLDKLIISIDTQGQRDIRGRYLTEILPALNAKTLKRPKVVFNFVVGGDNIDELASIYEFVAKACPDQLHVQFVENWYIPEQDGFDTMAAFVAKSRGVEGEIIAQVEACGTRLAKVGIAVTYGGSQRRGGACWWPFFGCFVCCDGLATPCCIRMHPEIFSLGNALEDDLGDIWYGTGYGEFRRSMFSTNANILCGTCPQ
ncbi:Radical SAM domain-containing protein [Candidatus Magnetobacterium bavaricum]|uniref:Radical SAM domain-containing protein n=1 Tax=Candidatus Magnetobacterium bavaricum TaxID=29290 RepID=A0A0F3GLT0_9BACT|nr:Radical SAM domain-containing protein [Candidatus Magnetobacterium bavaricum]